MKTIDVRKLCKNSFSLNLLTSVQDTCNRSDKNHDNKSNDQFKIHFNRIRFDFRFE